MKKITRCTTSDILKSINFLVALTLAMGAASSTLRAADTATSTWTGATAVWATGTNWSGGTPSASLSAQFAGAFTAQPQLQATPASTQGIWLATGVTQDVTITGQTSARVLNINGDATLSGQANAGIILDDTANHNLTLGNLTTTTLTNNTGFYVNNTGTLTVASGTGTLNLNGKTLTIAGTNASGATVIAGVASSAGGSIIVNTAGTATLSGTNTFTGGVTLTAGSLNINNATALGTVAGTFTINGGAINNTSGSAKTLTANQPITLGGNFAAYGSGSTSTSNLNLGTGAITNAGNRTITLNGTGTTLTMGGVMTNTSGAVQTTTVNGVGNTLVLGGYALSNNAASYNDIINGTGNLRISGAITNGGTATGSALTYSGTGVLTLSGTNTFTGGVTLNSGTLFVNSATALGGTAGAFVVNGGTIDSTGATVGVNPQTWNSDITYTGSTAATLAFGAGAVSLGTTPGATRTVTVSAGTLSTSGVVSDGVSATPTVNLTKAGAGTLTLSGNNLYSGTTTILNGTLVAANANALGTSSSAILLGDTAVLANNSKLSLGMAGGTLTRDVIVQAGNTGTATIGESGSSITNILAGTGTVTLGSGTVGHGLTLSNSSNSALQIAAKITDPTVGGTTSPGLVTIAGVNGITSAAGQTFLTNTFNNYSGGTLLASGRLGFSGTGTFLGTGTFVINTGAVTGGNSGGGFTQIAGATLQGNSQMVWNSDFLYENSGVGLNNLNLGAGAVSLGNGGQVAGSTRTLYVNAATLTVGGVISDSSSGAAVNNLTKAGAATLVLGGASLYTGSTSVLAGRLQLGSAGGNLPSTTGLSLSAGATSISAGASFDLNTRSQTITSLSGGSGTGFQSIVVNGGAATPSTLTVDTAGTSQYNGLIIGSTNTGTLALAKNSSGTLTLTGSNSYTGGTAVNGGTLVATGGVLSATAPSGVTGSGSLNGSTLTLSSTTGLVIGEKISGTGVATGTYITAINGSVVTLSNYLTASSSNLAMTFGGYNGSALGSGNVTVASGATVQLGDGTNNAGLSTGQTITSAGTVAFKNNGTAQTISNVISGGSAVNHLAGNVTLSGNNTYTGVTTISNGASLSLASSTVNSTIGSSSKIIVGDSGAATLDVTGISTAGGFQLKSGQTLAGHGTVVGDTTTLSGSTLSPGNSPGTTTFNGNLTLNSGTSLVFDLASVGASDQVGVTGTLTLNNQDFTNFTFSTLAGFGAGTYVLFDASSAIGGSLGSTLTSTQFTGYNATLSIDSLNNDLVLTVAVVPEPGTWAMMLGGLGILVAIQRRRNNLVRQ